MARWGPGVHPNPSTNELGHEKGAPVSASTLEAPVTARTMLFGDEDLSDLGRRLEDADVLGASRDRLATAGGSVWRSAHDELAGLVAGVLDVDVAAVTLAGWRADAELPEAGQLARDWGETALVPLGDRDISLVQHPQVDLVFGDVTLVAVRFELRVDIKARGVAGVVRDGVPVALAGGTCEVAVAFSAAGAPLARSTRRLEFGPALPRPA
jgi:hypothetical protein